MKNYWMTIGWWCLAGTLSAYTTPPHWSQTPWLPEALVFEPAVKVNVQSCHLATVQGSVGTAYDPFAVELGIEGFHSRKTNFAFEDAFLIGRYQWMNQNVGDPLAVVFGGKFALVSHLAYRERNLFHFGNVEWEGFASLGSEHYCSEFATEWASRWWLTAGAGIANRQSPWFTGNGAYEYTFSSQCRARAFADATIGVGHMQKGIDLGLAGTYKTLNYGAFDCSYAFRVYAKHAARYVSTVTLCYYP